MAGEYTCLREVKNNISHCSKFGDKIVQQCNFLPYCHVYRLSQKFKELQLKNNTDEMQLVEKVKVKIIIFGGAYSCFPIDDNIAVFI